MSFSEYLTINYWVGWYLYIKQFVYLFFFCIFYPPPKERRDIGSHWGGTSYYDNGNSGGGNGDHGSGGNGNNPRPPQYRGQNYGDNRGSVNRFQTCRRFGGG